MLRQRSCYKLPNAICNDGRDADQQESEEVVNTYTFANPVVNALCNWTTYNSYSAEFAPQARNNRMINCHDFRQNSTNESFNPFSINSNFLNCYLNLQSSIYGVHGAFYQPSYNFCWNAMGDSSDCNTQGVLQSQQRQNVLYQSHKDIDNSDNGECGLLFPPTPVPSLILPEPKFSESPFGTIFLVLQNLIRIDINAECNVYVTNHPGCCVAVLNLEDDESCIIHPNGKIFREGSTIHMQTDNKSAKICNRGVVFTGSTHVLRYLVDASGTKSTSEKIQDLSWDYSFEMFSGSKKGNNTSWSNSCYNLLSEAKFKNFNNGSKIWIVGGIRIKQDRFGEVSVAANEGRLLLKTSATVHSMSILSPTYFMSVSCHPFKHFFVRRGSKVVIVGKRSMSVQSGSQRAGFDNRNRLILH